MVSLQILFSISIINVTEIFVCKNNCTDLAATWNEFLTRRLLAFYKNSWFKIFKMPKSEVKQYCYVEA